MVIQTHSTHKKEIDKEADVVVFQPQTTSWRTLMYKDYKLIINQIDPEFMFSATKKISLIQFDMLEEIDLVFLLGLKHKKKIEIITNDIHIKAFQDYRWSLNNEAKNILINKIFEGDETKGIKFIANRKDIKNICAENTDLFSQVMCISDKLGIPRAKSYLNYKLYIPSITDIQLHVKNLDHIIDSILKTKLC